MPLHSPLHPVNSGHAEARKMQQRHSVAGSPYGGWSLSGAKGGVARGAAAVSGGGGRLDDVHRAYALRGTCGSTGALRPTRTGLVAPASSGRVEEAFEIEKLAQREFTTSHTDWCPRGPQKGSDDTDDFHSRMRDRLRRSQVRQPRPR